MTKNIFINRRWQILLSLLFGAFYLAFWADKTPNTVQEKMHSPQTTKPDFQVRNGQTPSPQSRPTPTHSSALATTLEIPTTLAAVIPRDQLIPTVNSRLQLKRDLFASQNWNPQPSPVSAISAIQETPSAPPLPFTYVGKKLEQGVWDVFLNLGDKTLVANQGSIFENLYRVDEIIPPHLTMTYLPLGVSQSLSIGESQ
ncbi:hypothetical protein HC248_02236 [Polaromonas vacuolata]|uniref:Secretion system X translation initiation factor n=1 Tax=Polaromonas vacuolata TaxID=37448 RepID=A0A6H2HAN8_9BURK|nr:hypothetical protein [Polaromonas vacuolata]QJC56925.1 hypothetical protein HC248_02236 [Polaromonas vacuolata]